MSMDDEYNGGSSSLGLVAAACVLAVGLGVGGYYFSQALQTGLERINMQHSVTVKGLSEKAVKADLALWSLRFVATSNDLPEAQLKISNDMKMVIDFLKSQGLNENDFTAGRTDVVDLLAREYRNENVRDNRFILYGNVMIRSNNVDLVQTISRRLGEVVKSGVIFTTEGVGATASLAPYFMFTRLNDVKPEMLIESTRSARLAAEQFASEAAVPLGKLVKANQGVFSIFPGDQYPNATEETQINKTVRVVSTIEYALGK